MSDSPRQPVNRDAWWTRDHVLVIVLFVAIGILVVLCWKLVQPFVTPLAWALALAVVAHPLHGWLARRIKKPGLAAGIAVFAIALVLTGLVIFVGQTLVSSIASGTQTFQSFFQGGQWREQLARIPGLGSLLTALEQQVNLGGQLQSMAGEVGKRVSEFAAGSVWVLVQVVLTFLSSSIFSGIGVKPSARCVRSSRSRKRRLIKYLLGWRTPFMPPSSARSRSLRCKARSAA